MIPNDVTIVYVCTSWVGKMAPRVVKLCFAFIRSIPVVFITAVIAWSYYAYVVQMCICEYNDLCVLLPFFHFRCTLTCDLLCSSGDAKLCWHQAT